MGAVLFLCGCEYEAPLTKKHTTPIDPAVLGLWETLPENSDEEKERMMILKFSSTEYISHYPVRGNAMYFQAYPIKVGGVSCVQLQAIGSNEGPPDQGEKGLYHVASYQLSDAKLEIKLLNEKLVDDELKKSAELTRAFLEHKENKNLFANPVKFRRIK